MRYITLAIVLLLPVSNLLAQSHTIDVADSLIDIRKYESAYRVLDHADPDNNDAEIVSAKSTLLLSYFAKSINHVLFGLTDLAPGVELDSLRELPVGTYSMHEFRGDSLFDRLLKRHPEDYTLNLGLGNYYYDVFIHYGENWFISDSALVDNAQAQLFEALRHGVRDRNTYSRLGYLSLSIGDYSVAAGYYRTAIDSGSIDVSDYYNIAVCDLYQNKHPEGVSYAQYAYDHYSDQFRRADAAQVLASLYDDLGKYDSARKFNEMCLKLDPENAAAMKQAVVMHLKFGQPDLAAIAAEQYFDSVAGQETLNDIVRAFHEANHDPELVQWFDKMERKYSNDDESSGGLRLVEGQFYLITGDLPNARKTLNSARTYFQQVYDEDNEVFPFIEELLQKAQ